MQTFLDEDSPECATGQVLSVQRRLKLQRLQGRIRGRLEVVFVDVALQVYADFFFHDGPIHFFFGVGLFDRFQDDLAGAGHEFLAVVAEHAAGDDFGLHVHLASVLVDGDDGNQDAVFGKVFAVTDYRFLDFFQRAGIYQDTACSYGVAAIGAVFCEFDDLAVFHQENFTGDAAEAGGLGRRGGRDDDIRRGPGNEIFGLTELQD